MSPVVTGPSDPFAHATMQFYAILIKDLEKIGNL
jgi:hypothetical protein